MSRAVTVLAAGLHTTVQDGGRPGLAHLGVPRSGWLDPGAARLANRLVGNPEETAVLECVLGGLRLHAQTAVSIAVTGARCPVSVDGRQVPFAAAVTVRRGQVVSLGTPRAGLRSWVALSGGVDAEPVLGSRATDTLSGLGPPRVVDGAVLPLGPVAGPVGSGEWVGETTAPTVLDCHPGPRTDWFGDAAWATLTSAVYVVQPHSDRVAVRLAGPALNRERTEELPSEGIVLGAVQVPADGQPLVFLADHPTTGGYPVVAVLDPAAVPGCAQLRPGDQVRFRPRPR